jgi:hypothetical protein
MAWYLVKHRICLHKLILWRRVLEELIVSLLVKKFPTFNGTQNFITVFIRVRHWSLS